LVKIHFACPVCERPGRWHTDAPWQCSHCDHFLPTPPATGVMMGLTCAICSNTQFYKKKDFPHWLGLTILAVACLAFLIGNAIYHQWWAWAILIGSAVFDGLLYLWVGDVVVCYRCGAHYRGVPSQDFQPFDLGIAERYRQERLRQQEMAKASREPQ
jgi:hypothetical protein